MIRTKDEVSVLERKRVFRVHQQHDIWIGKLEKDGYDPTDAASYQVKLDDSPDEDAPTPWDEFLHKLLSTYVESWSFDPSLLQPGQAKRMQGELPDGPHEQVMEACFGQYMRIQWDNSEEAAADPKALTSSGSDSEPSSKDASPPEPSSTTISSLPSMSTWSDDSPEGASEG